MEMKEILNRFSDCDTFSLSMRVSRHNMKDGVFPIPEYKITEEEYITAVKKLREHAESKPYNCNTDTEIRLIDDLEDRKKLFLFNGETDPKDEIPKQLRDSFIRYEVSFFNNASVCYDLLCINYYFKLNEETKKYLLKYKTDFDLYYLEDLAIYKNGELKFSSNTHEKYNTFEK